MGNHQAKHTRKVVSGIESFTRWTFFSSSDKAQFGRGVRNKVANDKRGNQ